MQARESGIIKTYLPDSGYGFIRPRNADSDVFFHVNQSDGIAEEELRPGVAVEFEIVADLRRAGRFRAVRVTAAGEESR